MNKQKIKIVDTQFDHGKSFGTGDLQIPPTSFDWYRGNDNINDLVVFTEDTIHTVDTYIEKYKIAFLLEAPCKKAKVYDLVKDPTFNSKFNCILTYDKRLISLNPNKFKFYPFGGCWILPHEQKVYKKCKNFSIIASSKRSTHGQRLRHDVINKCGNRLDGIFGNGYKFIESKLEGLKDYRYSFIIENESVNCMFSEKLIDCFMTGTIPIYYGCKGKIGDYFNINSIIQFNNINELPAVLETCTEQFFNNNQESIQENFELAKQYLIPEDYMWHYFKHYLEEQRG